MTIKGVAERAGWFLFGCGAVLLWWFIAAWSCVLVLCAPFFLASGRLAYSDGKFELAKK